MDTYFTIGAFALLATAVMGLPTIFPPESSSSPVSTSTENGTWVTNATTEHPHVSLEPLPSHKFKRGVFDGLFGYATESTTGVSTTGASLNITGSHNFTDVTTAGHIVEPVSFQPPLPKFKRSLDIWFLRASTANSSAPFHVSNVTAFPSENASVPHHNATQKPFPFFQNDEPENTSEESSEEKSSSHGGITTDNSTSDFTSTSNDSSSTPYSVAFIQNDEPSVKPPVSIEPFNVTAFNFSDVVTHSNTVPPAQPFDLSAGANSSTVRPIGSFTYKYPFFS